MMRRFSVPFFLFGLFCLASVGHGWAQPGLVVDVETGAVLFEQEATQAWHPASLTKLMSAYVTFRAIQSGQIGKDSLVTISARSTHVKPSKMGMKPGMTVTVDNALKILMVKSANDIAVALAERVGGNVEGFVSLMNRESARLGMTQTHFVNPHGLHDEAQQTSARDMALLAMAILREFPQHRGYFGLPAIALGPRVMQNHNGLIGRYPAADGMKTGFICASGFNVVASAQRGGQQLVAVVFGAQNANERTEQTARLFENGFSGVYRGNRPISSLDVTSFGSPPNLREELCTARGRAEAGERSGDDVGGQEADGDGQAGFGRSSLLLPKLKPEPVAIFLGRSFDDPVNAEYIALQESYKKPKKSRKKKRKA